MQRLQHLNVERKQSRREKSSAVLHKSIVYYYQWPKHMSCSPSSLPTTTTFSAADTLIDQTTGRLMVDNCHWDFWKYNTGCGRWHYYSRSVFLVYSGQPFLKHCVKQTLHLSDLIIIIIFYYFCAVIFLTWQRVREIKVEGVSHEIIPLIPPFFELNKLEFNCVFSSEVRNPSRTPGSPWKPSLDTSSAQL